MKSDIQVPSILWKNGFKSRHLDAAQDYLALRLTPERAAKVIPMFNTAPISRNARKRFAKGLLKGPSPDDGSGRDLEA